MTLPQIVILNHAAAINGKRMEARVKGKSDAEQEDSKDPVVWHDKKLSQLNSEEYQAYYGELF